jgi:hypothetical protein
MTVRYSTAVANSLLTKIDQDFTNCVIDFYSGNQPLKANDPPNGVLLARATLDGATFNEGVAANGLNFADPAAGVLSKESAEQWKYTGLAIGTIRWFRLRANAVDDGSQSTTLFRVDGSAGTLSGDILVSQINMVVGTPGTIDVFNLKHVEAA